jgi:hypothetical protein
MSEGEKKVEISEDLKDIVATTIDSVKEALKGRDVGLVEFMEFEVAVVKSKEAKAGFKFFVADASGNYSKESISRVKFKVMGNQVKGFERFVWGK